MTAQVTSATTATSACEGEVASHDVTIKQGGEKSITMEVLSATFARLLRAAMKAVRK